ncbi:MAG: hypothetical protein Q8Q29_09260 [Actinomycetota bacterium]|nr:hypothetical protein [Actinomycetota bacterium]
MPVLCPLCARNNDTQTHWRDDGIKFAVCLDRSHGPEGFVWEPTPPPGRSMRSEGLGSELGVWDKLLEVVEPGEFQSYGVVEDRFVERFPEETLILAERFGHRWRFPEHPSSQYSMSAYPIVIGQQFVRVDLRQSTQVLLFFSDPVEKLADPSRIDH